LGSRDVDSGQRGGTPAAFRSRICSTFNHARYLPSGTLVPNPADVFPFLFRVVFADETSRPVDFSD
jgi:hypothetical protein